VADDAGRHVSQARQLLVGSLRLTPAATFVQSRRSHLSQVPTHARVLLD
jgi:hypothetical protein